MAIGIGYVETRIIKCPKCDRGCFVSFVTYRPNETEEVYYCSHCQIAFNKKEAKKLRWKKDLWRLG